MMTITRFKEETQPHQQQCNCKPSQCNILRLYIKYILVTQKQVLELYITVIECKTLYAHWVSHTAFPNAFAMQQLQQQS